MKIAIFTDDFLPKIDGISTSTVNLAKGLSDKGHEIIIICSKNKNMREEFNYPNVKIVRMRGIPAFFYPEFYFTSPFSIRVFNLIRREKVDLIHFQTQFTIGFLGIIISKLLRIPLSGRFNTNISHPDYLKHSGLSNRFVQYLSEVYNKFFYNRCDLVSCPGEDAKKILLDLGIKRKLSVISYGVNFSLFDNSKSKKIRSKYPGKKIVLFVGRVAHEKNLSGLLLSFLIALKKNKDLLLLIVGDGPQFKDISSEIDSKGLSSKVKLLGSMEYDKLLKSGIYGAADIFASASPTETFGISTLEAMVNFLPIVGVDEGGVRDLVKTGHNGYLVKNYDWNSFGEKLALLANNSALRRKLGKNSNTESKKHDMKRVIDIWEKEFLNLISHTN